MNPISRLAQIQQAKKEKEPEYVLLSERGMPRRREFVMQVSSAVTLEIMPLLCYVQTQAKWGRNMKRMPLCLSLCFTVSYTRRVWNTVSESQFELPSFLWWNKWQLGYVPSRCFSCSCSAFLYSSYFYFTWWFLSWPLILLLVHDLLTFTCLLEKNFFLLWVIRGLQYRQVFWNMDMNITKHFGLKK